MAGILRHVVNNCESMVDKESYFIIPGQDEDCILSIDFEGKIPKHINNVRDSLFNYKGAERIFLTPIGYIKITKNPEKNYSVEVKSKNNTYNMSFADFDTIVEYIDELLGGYQWYC